MTDVLRTIEADPSQELDPTGIEDAGAELEFDELWRPDAAGSAPRGPEGILLANGVVTQAQLDRARTRQKEKPQLTVMQMLRQAGDVDEQQALQAMAEYFKLPFATLEMDQVDQRLFSMLPVEFIRAKNVIPIRQEEGFVVVGLTDPANIFLIDEVKRRLRKPLKLTVVAPADVQRVVDELAPDDNPQIDDIIKDIDDDDVEVVESATEEVTDLEKMAGESPVIRYVNYLITNAVREGASDIHIEPGDKSLKARYRIDGILFDQTAPPWQLHAAIVSRLKIMADLDIAERRLPQDGRIQAMVHGRHVDLRVSILPTTHGEKCVIRILDNRSIMTGLEQLGIERDTLEVLQHQINEPHGVVIVTGPTGSGKTTTLYSAIRQLDGDKLNISTVEDPVEYELGFANQVNVSEKIGLTFASALRSLLRQDPDVIMVGEIRDEETARIAVQASLTGHLVFSTLHTNDAPSSITRLINIGIEPYLISASVNAVLAQRLIRKICPNCTSPVEQHSVGELLARYGVDDSQIMRGAGCEQCRDTGYQGRTGIYEFFVVDDDSRDMITSNPSLTQLRRYCRNHGMRSLRENGFRKVAAGQTTVDEILRVTESEQEQEPAA